MLKNIPYSTLKQDKRAYEIMLLHDQHENTFADIAGKYEISLTRVRQIYTKLKIKQMRLYVRHIAIVLGHSDTSQTVKVYYAANEWYQDYSYACAYLEQQYKDILTAYRGGEPGMSAQIIKSIPPFKPKLSEKTIARVVEMREVKKDSFVTIGKELCMTRDKAKQVYDHFYHAQVLELIEALQDKTESKEEKDAIFDYYFKTHRSSKARYDILMKNNLS